MLRPLRRLGCLGSLIFAFVLVLGVTALLAPWAFHIGGRWTPTTNWQGVGRLVDSAGQSYGLYTSFSPDFRDRRGIHVSPGRPTPQFSLRGKASVCTPSGMRIRFDLRGDIFGAWRDVDGKLIVLNLAEPGNARPRRHFTLYGSFDGPALSMDDHKTMFMYLLSDGNLTPARSYTAPVPEKHARVTLEWGTEADYDRLCRDLSR